jgi:HAE1 family hydrophobic/amphiphilic exporter-1
MNISEISIKNPVFAWMLMLGIMLFGLLSFKGMGVSQMPEIDFPVMSVDVTWEGAAPEVMETDVVDIVEDAVMGVEGLKEVSSTSRQGQANITLEFFLNRNIDVALQEVQSKLSEAQRRLPKEMDPPIITKVNPQDMPIMWIGVYSNRELVELMDFVDRHVKDQFKTIPGVGGVMMGGFSERNLRVWIDIDKLNAYELSVKDITDAIEDQHVEIPAGRIETDKKEANVRAMGEARSPEEFGKIVIEKRNGKPNYKPILLKEVATIENGLADIRKMSRIMGTTAIGLGIRKQPGANAVEVARMAKKRIEEVRKRLPPGYNIVVSFDRTKFIEDSIDELVFTLVLSGLLTSLVCWLFLGSWSSTFNILLAIPTSMLGAFMLLKFAGFTLNTFTLLGLSLAIGIVVDDAIMVLENIVRHREKGETQLDASLNGAREISLAALAATTAIIAIFLPVVFMKGIIGKFFFEFGITITVAVALSLMEALTFAPMRCSQFLDVGERKTWFGKIFESSFKQANEFYRKILVISLRYKWRVIIGAFIFFAVSLLTIAPLRKEFVPAQDQSIFLTKLQLPVGSSIEFTSQRFKQAEAIVKDNPNVVRYFAAIGGFQGGEVSTGMLFVTLKSPKDRPVDPIKHHRLSQFEIMDYFRVELNKIPDVKAYLQDMSTMGMTAQRGFPIEFTVRGPDWEKLVEYSDKIRDKMGQSDLFADVDTDYLSGMPEVRVYPDRDKCFQYAVDMDTIATTINALIGGERVGKYTEGGRRYDIRVKLLAEQRSRKEDINKLMIWNNRGEMVRLADVLRVEEKPSLLAITRRGRERAIGIFSNVGPGKSQATAIEQAQKIAKEILPEDYRIVLTGTSETFKESFQSLIFALILGIIVAYMVLASQFNHIIHPFTVLLALPFSLSGAFIALLIGNQSLNIFSLIGLLLLMGIVKKNSILLVEFTNQQRARGLSTIEALKTACPVRFRPIVMTSVATISAAIPPALAMGPGAETRIPMAMAIIGGVLVSTLLTLFVVPSAYLIFSRLEENGTISKISGRLTEKLKVYFSLGLKTILEKWQVVQSRFFRR